MCRLLLNAVAALAMPTSGIAPDSPAAYLARGPLLSAPANRILACALDVEADDPGTAHAAHDAITARAARLDGLTALFESALAATGLALDKHSTPDQPRPYVLAQLTVLGEPPWA